MILVFAPKCLVEFDRISKRACYLLQRILQLGFLLQGFFLKLVRSSVGWINALGSPLCTQVKHGHACDGYFREHMEEQFAHEALI